MGLRSTKFLTIHGGYCNNTTANYGTFYLNLNNTTSNANWNIDASILIHNVLNKALRLYEGHWQRIHNQLEVKHHVKLV